MQVLIESTDEQVPPDILKLNAAIRERVERAGGRTNFRRIEPLFLREGINLVEAQSMAEKPSRGLVRPIESDVGSPSVALERGG